LGDICPGTSHIWHSKKSLRYTEIFGKLACSVCSKILGIGLAEHAEMLHVSEDLKYCIAEYFKKNTALGVKIIELKKDDKEKKEE
jgi:hypothetical protein